MMNSIENEVFKFLMETSLELSRIASRLEEEKTSNNSMLQLKLISREMSDRAESFASSLREKRNIIESKCDDILDAVSKIQFTAYNRYEDAEHKKEG